MLEEDKDTEWVKVICALCSSEHLNSPDVSYPLCDDCLHDYYEEEE